LVVLGVAQAGSLPILRGSGRAPRWPEGVVGSITHTAGMAAAAAAHAADYAGVGLDLERVGRASVRLMRRTLRPEERARLEALPEADRGATATIVFCAKESIFKALNPATGIFLGFQDAELERLPPPGAPEGEFRWRLPRGCGRAFPPGFTATGRFVRREGFVLSAVWIPAGAGCQARAI
jgi:enterobactin synthetase component D